MVRIYILYGGNDGVLSSDFVVWYKELIVKVFINRHTAIGNRRIAYQRNLAATLYVFV